MLTRSPRPKISLTRPRVWRQRARELPLRAELFGVEQLARHAQAIAAQHKLVAGRTSARLLTRLDQNEKVLRAFNRATLAVDQGRQVTSAAEWLLDNFYLIEEQIQLARRHLPEQYSRELPRLANGPSAGFLRVYDIVLELIAHVDAQIDADSLSAFVAAYQTVAPLKLGELWAVPIMLRLGLIENLARITTGLAQGRRDRDLANQWVERLQAMAEKNPSRIVIVVADMARAEPTLSSSFVAEFCQRLSRLNPVLHFVRGWLEQRLAEQGLSIELLVHQDSQSQASDQVSVSHSITSLRLLSAIDWKKFVETLSQVEQTLRADPADVYRDMDFATRDRYRHVVESLAKQSEHSETDVARKAVQLAEESARQKRREDRTAHVGFYLVDKGLPLLERTVHARWPWSSIVERSIRRFPLTFYLGGIFLVTVLGTFNFMDWAQALEVRGWRLILFTLVFLLGVSQLAVALINWLSTLLVKPRLLPRLDYSHGIPPESRTIVVIPTILNSLEGIDSLIERLEIHHLANRDPRLHFALLTDFRDAPEEVLPEDEPLLQRVRTGVEKLNRKYYLAGSDFFFLFHRPRLWNPGEGSWLGYERKRGKLAGFNAFLRGGCGDCFSEIIGRNAILPAIRYVITLDTDTQLPRDSARQLAATMAHPLNRPQFDPERGVVTEGYGLLQPRVEVSLPSAARSRFGQVFAGDAGIDPYTRAVSDVYQDVFREGSFIGKGIYDVDAFERALAGRFPENRVLSHDLLESCHARCALVSDVKFYEEYPSRYRVDVNRRHRWVRGDWQIMEWILPRVPGADGRHIPNPLSGLSWWKIFDNLRRSLVPAALLLFLLGTWLLLPEIDGLVALLVLVIITLPAVLSALIDLLRKPDELPWLMHLRGVGASSGRQLSQIVLTLVFLPYETIINLDAVGRTLWRLLVTRKGLLEWQISSDASRTARADLAGLYFTMWITPSIALASGLSIAIMHPTPLLLALPLMGVWHAAPWIAWWISQPIEPSALDLTSEQLFFLRRTARNTWHFFETFVTAEQNWLPPDNFQEDPLLIASRTSPTNIGLALLANLAARDFGYLSVGRFIRRTQDTFPTMQPLDRHRGHFYNWYATRTLQPLLPLYVSSVDSGNLTGNLLVLGAGLRELVDEKIFSPQIFAGLRDTVGVLRQLGGDKTALSQLEAELEETPSSLRVAFRVLERAANQARQISASLANREEEPQWWGQTLQRNCEEHLEELLFLAPWLRSGDEALHVPENLAEKIVQLDQGPTLLEI